MHGGSALSPKIAVVEGDGIGKEVIPVAVTALKTVREDLDFFPVDVGCTRWNREGVAIDEKDIEALRSADAILFGAITTPPDPSYRSIVVRIRKELDLYANVRPVRAKGVSVTVVRENTEGLYAGVEEITPERATTLRIITRKGSERVARFACGMVQPGETLTIGHKANVIKADTLFLNTCREVAAGLGVPFQDRYIDALCLDVLMHPGRYPVIVTENMFGDIVSDVTAYLAGGLGMLPSANIGDRYALFEPVHGSAPDIAGRGIANPAAAVLSAALLVRHLGDGDSALRLEKAVSLVIASGKVTPDLGGTANTESMGRAIFAAL
jgi:methanogen homoisocitrate dehydrogenase